MSVYQKKKPQLIQILIYQILRILEFDYPKSFLTAATPKFLIHIATFKDLYQRTKNQANSFFRYSRSKNDWNLIGKKHF